VFLLEKYKKSPFDLGFYTIVAIVSYTIFAAGPCFWHFRGFWLRYIAALRFIKVVFAERGDLVRLYKNSDWEIRSNLMVIDTEYRLML
jgi:hypothetical protein